MKLSKRGRSPLIYFATDPFNYVSKLQIKRLADKCLIGSVSVRFLFVVSIFSPVQLAAFFQHVKDVLGQDQLHRVFHLSARDDQRIDT